MYRAAIVLVCLDLVWTYCAGMHLAMWLAYTRWHVPSHTSMALVYEVTILFFSSPRTNFSRFRNVIMFSALLYLSRVATLLCICALHYIIWFFFQL